MTDVTPRFKQPKKRRTVATSPSLAKEKATRLHSLIVRSKGVCENCGYECPCGDRWPEHYRHPTCMLECAHIIRRNHIRTRTDERNAFCLCHACHSHFEAWPIEFAEFVLSKIGLGLYAELRDQADTKDKDGDPKPKFDWLEELRRLEALWIAVGGS